MNLHTDSIHKHRLIHQNLRWNMTAEPTNQVKQSLWLWIEDQRYNTIEWLILYVFSFAITNFTKPIGLTEFATWSITWLAVCWLIFFCFFKLRNHRHWNRKCNYARNNWLGRTTHENGCHLSLHFKRLQFWGDRFIDPNRMLDFLFSKWQ